MKKTYTMALLALVTALAVAPLPAWADVTATALVMPDGKIVEKHAHIAKKTFRYLDMAAKTHPSSIRNAVVVYEYGLVKDRGEVREGQSGSTRLHVPST